MTHQPIISKDGQQFPSVRQACRILKISRSTLIKRIARGIDMTTALDPDFKNASKIALTVNDITFESLTDAAAHFGVKYSTFLDRQSLGWSIEEALGLTPRVSSLPSEHYMARITAYAAANKINIKVAESRLTRRRRRFRKWLDLAPLDNSHHANALHVQDSQGNRFYSHRIAAKAKQCRTSAIKQKLTPAVSHPYPVRLALDSEMKISFETLFLLMSHPNVIEREPEDQRQTLLLGTKITCDITLVRHADVITSVLTIEDIVVIKLLIQEQTIIEVSSILVTKKRDKWQKRACIQLKKGCSYRRITDFENALKDHCAASMLSLNPGLLASMKLTPVNH